jgi:hypothetical protein
MTGALARPDRVYLGWEYAPRHGDPGPPPPRPQPPEAEEVNPGWVAAQRREERRLSRPARTAALAGLTAAAGCAAAGLSDPAVVSPPLAGAGVAVAGVIALAGARGVWHGQRDLRRRLAAEERRVALARASADRRRAAELAGHARRLRDWQAHGRAFRTQPQWYGVTLPAAVDRIDVAGGTLEGWSALTAMLAGFRLAAGGEVTVLDLSEGAVARDLLGLAGWLGVPPRVWVLPGDLPRLGLGTGVPGAVLADLLAMAAAAAVGPASPVDPEVDAALLERVAGALGGCAGVAGPAGLAGPGFARVTAGLRVLAQVGDPREEVRRGLLTEAETEAVAGLYGRAAADRVIVERALVLEARLRPLAGLGGEPAGLGGEPAGLGGEGGGGDGASAGWSASRLRVVALHRSARLTGGPVLGGYVTAALTQLLRTRPRAEPWQHTVLLCGAERLRGELLDRLSDACESAGTGLVLCYRSLAPHVRDRLGRGNAAVAFMRLGNAEDARVASEQIGTEHRFVVAQLTDTVGASLTDTAGDAYTSTVGTASNSTLSRSSSEGTGHSGGRGQSWTGLSAFAPRTASAHGETSYSTGVSDSASITEGISAGTSWGRQTARAAGISLSDARTSQRSREFLVEQHTLQQLPPSAVLASYASAAGRRVVLADANPGILGLPTATLQSRDEAWPSASSAGGEDRSAGGEDRCAGGESAGSAWPADPGGAAGWPGGSGGAAGWPGGSGGAAGWPGDWEPAGGEWPGDSEGVGGWPADPAARVAGWGLAADAGPPGADWPPVDGSAPAPGRPADRVAEDAGAAWPSAPGEHADPDIPAWDRPVTWERLAGAPRTGAAPGSWRPRRGEPPWAGPVSPPTRDPAEAPLSWRDDDSPQ